MFIIIFISEIIVINTKIMFLIVWFSLNKISPIIDNIIMLDIGRIDIVFENFSVCLKFAFPLNSFKKNRDLSLLLIFPV